LHTQVSIANDMGGLCMLLKHLEGSDEPWLCVADDCLHDLDRPGGHGPGTHEVKPEGLFDVPHDSGPRAFNARSTTGIDRLSLILRGGRPGGARRKSEPARVLRLRGQ